MHFVNLIKIRSFDLLPEITKHHTKVKSGDLTIMHDNIVQLKCKLSSDWLKIHVTEQEFCKISMQ